MLPSGCHLPHLLIGTSSSPLLPRCALGWTYQLAFQLVLQVRLARLQQKISSRVLANIPRTRSAEAFG